MIIVQIITALGIGGAEKLLVHTANRLAQHHTLHIIYLKNIDDLVPEINEKVTVKRIPLSLLTIRKIADYCKNIKADIIHTHLGHADILGLIASRKLESKVFCTLHNSYFKKNFIDQVYFKVYRHLFLKSVPQSKVIAISKAVKNHAMHYLKVPEKRIFLLYNAIEEKKMSTIDRDDREIKILFVGRLEKQKSVATLLRAMHQLKQEQVNSEYSLTIVGDGSKRQEIEKLSKKLNIDDRVNFKGKLASLDQIYNESHIFVLPSIWEGFGIVLLEAFRSKLAVVASNIEGPAELIQNNESGMLFEPKNALDLAQKMKSLLNDTAQRQRLAENGFKSFTSDYQMAAYVEKLENIYLNA